MANMKCVFELRHASVAMVKQDSGNEGMGEFQMGTLGVQCVQGAKWIWFECACACMYRMC